MKEKIVGLMLFPYIFIKAYLKMKREINTSLWIKKYWGMK